MASAVEPSTILKSKKKRLQKARTSFEGRLIVVPSNG